MNSYQKQKVLIIIKTYPNISSKYEETVCTAGITENGEWIRLYPVDYRYQPYQKWFKKYQWIEVDVTKHTGDPRMESHRPNLETLKILGEPIGTNKGKWSERKEFILPLVNASIEELKENAPKGQSLGIIRPLEVSEFVVEAVDREWGAKKQAVLDQPSLFGTPKKPLDKIPYKFSYRFKCDDERCTGHKLMIEDWEIGALYRNCLERAKGDEADAVKKVREKYEGFIQKTDLHLILGTTRADHHRGTFVIIGLFNPML